jgi:hypothetical protein
LALDNLKWPRYDQVDRYTGLVNAVPQNFFSAKVAFCGIQGKAGPSESAYDCIKVNQVLFER